MKGKHIMTIRLLKIFITVYQKESITEAASALNMTQPTVTRAIQELEDHYSLQLFERIHRRLYVTEAGKQLYKQAVHVVSSLDQLEKDMTDWDQNGVLRVGASTTLGCILLPGLISEFQKTHPGLALNSLVSDRADVQNRLLHNEIDFALIDGIPDDPDLKMAFLGKDRMVLILPPEHPLCWKENLTVQDLSGQPIVISGEGSASRNFLEHLFSLHSMTLKPVMESGSIPAIIQAVQAGIGISLVPQALVSLYAKRDSITERKLSYEVLSRDNHIVWHESKYLGKNSREFIDLAKSLGRKVLV